MTALKRKLLKNDECPPVLSLKNTRHKKDIFTAPHLCYQYFRELSKFHGLWVLRNRSEIEKQVLNCHCEIQCSPIAGFSCPVNYSGHLVVRLQRYRGMFYYFVKQFCYLTIRMA